MDITQAILQQQIMIDNARAAIKEIADACEHPQDALVVVRTSDTGNWDRGDDTYFKTVTCRICGSQSHYSKNTGRNAPEVLDRVVQMLLPISI